MRIQNQFGASSFVAPRGHEKKTISALTDHGLITDICEGGFPIFTPLGTKIIENIERIFHDNATAAGFDLMRIPNAMRTDTLEKGQPISDQFRQKIMNLTGNLKDYHIISTPETHFVKWSLTHQLSHHQLPVRMYYMDELHRQMPYTKGSLITRQIRICGGISVEQQDKNGGELSGIGSIRKIIIDSLTEIGLPIHQEKNFNGFSDEFFYLSSDRGGPVEGDNVALPSINATQRTRGFSVGMIYEYPMEKDFAIRFRNEKNKDERASLISFGVCSQRVLCCMMMEYHDAKGFNLPASIRPFDVYIVPAAKKDCPAAEELYSNLSKAFNKSARPGRVAIDSRLNKTVNDRNASADYIGAAFKIVLNGDKVTVFNRAGGKVIEIQESDPSVTTRKLLQLTGPNATP